MTVLRACEPDTALCRYAKSNSQKYCRLCCRVSDDHIAKAEVITRQQPVCMCLQELTMLCARVLDL